MISYAHRGGSFEAPSSTVGALEHAVKVGISGLELDVHSTVDGILVCCHDSVVDTTTNGRGKVSKMTWEEISALNAGYWYVADGNGSSVQGRPAEDYIFRAPELRGEKTRLARVDEVLARFPKQILNFDIKSTAPSVEPYEHVLAALIFEYGAEDRVIVSSFLDPAIWKIRQSFRSISTSAAPGEISEFYFALTGGVESAVNLAMHAPYVAFQIPRFFGEIELATPRFIEAAHKAGKAVHVWTINDQDEMELLLDMGVDGIISDRPSLVVSVVGDHSHPYFYSSS